MFVNKLDPFYATMHSMGLFYTKDSEGSLYPNGTNEFAPGNAVAPGGCVVYKWLIPPASAPDAGETLSSGPTTAMSACMKTQTLVSLVP